MRKTELACCSLRSNERIHLYPFFCVSFTSYVLWSANRVIFTMDDGITIGSRRGLNLGSNGLQFLAPSAIWASLLQLIQFFDWPKIFLNDKWRHKGLPFSSLWRPILILRFRFLHQIRLTSPTHKKINLINIL